VISGGAEVRSAKEFRAGSTGWVDIHFMHLLTMEQDAHQILISISGIWDVSDEGRFRHILTSFRKVLCADLALEISADYAVAAKSFFLTCERSFIIDPTGFLDPAITGRTIPC
jgi:hypothetical protein